MSASEAHGWWNTHANGNKADIECNSSFLILYIVTLGMQHVDSSGWGNAYRSSLRNAFYIIPRIQHFFLHLSAAAVIVSQLSLVPHSRTRTARLAGAGLGAIVAVLAVAVMGLTISFDFRGSASTSSWSDVLERHQASAAINFVVFLLLVLGAASSLLWTLAVGYFPVSPTSIATRNTLMNRLTKL